MPYEVRKMGEGWEIINKHTGKRVGVSRSKKMAEASVRARMAAENQLK